MSQQNHDVESLLKDVKFFNGKLYYKVNSYKESNKLLNNRNEFKKFIVLDITAGEIFHETELTEKFQSEDTVDILMNHLNSIKYKVYKEIRIKL